MTPKGGYDIARSSAVIRAVVVEKDDDPRQTTRLKLEQQGFIVMSASDGHAGYAVITDELPDVAVIDVAMLGADGLTLTRRLVTERVCPVVCLTALNLGPDVLAGFEVDADDYVAKPFDGEALAARIRAVLRRTSPALKKVEEVADLVIDRTAMTVYRGHQELPVSTTEFRVLTFMLDHRGAVLSRSQILAHVWGHSHGGDGRTVDADIQRLRAKLETDAIVTVRGAGYKLVGP